MDEQERNGQHKHGGIDHGIGMVLGCLVPMAAIVLLPRFGVSPTASIVVGVVGMLALHAGMAVFHRVKNRVAGNGAAASPAGHHH